jgi:hypothetical protein
VRGTGLAEMALRLAHYGEDGYTHLQSFLEYDSLLGWRHKRNYSTLRARPDYQTEVTYDANGVPGADPLNSKPAGVGRIVVLANSHLDGYTVPTQDRLSEVLASGLGPRFEVVSLGVGAYSGPGDALTRPGWLEVWPDVVMIGMNFTDIWLNGWKHLERQRKPAFVLEGEGGELRLTNVLPPLPVRALLDRFKVLALIRTAIKGNRTTHKMAIQVGLLHDEQPMPAGAGGDQEEFGVSRKDANGGGQEGLIYYAGSVAPNAARSFAGSLSCIPLMQTIMRRSFVKSPAEAL